MSTSLKRKNSKCFWLDLFLLLHGARNRYINTLSVMPCLVSVSIYSSLKTSFMKWKPDYDSAASEYGKAGTALHLPFIQRERESDAVMQ